MNKMPLITLTTDFGHKDGYAAQMKGVILGINPKANVIDISHEIRPHDVREASFALASCAPYFPQGTIHIVVVDPGVGTDRRLLCVRTNKGIFMGPDNGCLAWILNGAGKKEIRQIVNGQFMAKRRSQTFHGRDILAPTAAHLSKKRSFSLVGPKTQAITRLFIAKPAVSKSGVRGEVLHIDHFGNIVTNIRKIHLKGLGEEPVLVLGRNRIPFGASSYEETDSKPMGLMNSMDLVEIALYGDSAAKRLRVRKGDFVIAT